MNFIIVVVGTEYKKENGCIMKLRIGNKIDEENILNIRPHAADLFQGKSYFIIAEDEESELESHLQKSQMVRFLDLL